MTKGRYNIYIGIVVCCCLFACSEHGGILPEGQKQDISLSAVVDEVRTVSRSGTDDGAYTGTVPSLDNELEAAVWFSLNSGSYPAVRPDDPISQTTNIPVHTTIKFTSGTATFPENLPEDQKPQYPTTGSVYCVGFYPKDSWELVENHMDTLASHALSGTQDLMFAPEISGSWNQHFTTQRYRHMLTWLKVCVCATSTEANKYWGKLKKITLHDVSDSITVNLKKVEKDSFSLKKTVTYSKGKRNVDILDSPAGIDLKITTQDVTSAFCEPKPSYTLTIECTNGKAANINVDLKELAGYDKNLLSYPAGLQYVLILYFHPFNVVEGVCTLNAWNAQNEDLYPQIN